MTITKGYANTPSGQIHYRHVPGTGTPVVFYHRTPATSKCFERMLLLMAGGRPLFAFDTPGFGESFRPSGMPSIDAYADWMLEALSDIGLQKVHVFGHHTGTNFSTEMAIKAPERIASITLNGIMYFGERIRKQIMDENADEIHLDVNGGYVSEIWKGVSEMFSLYDMSLEMLHEEFVSMLNSIDGRYQALIAILEQDYKSAFAKITCPILLMSAKDDPLEPLLENALAARPDAKAVILGDARFFSPERDTSRTVDALKLFLSEVEH